MAHLPVMRVLLDGNPVVIDRPTLAQALSAGAAHAKARGRVIIEAKADGATLTDDQLGTPSDEPGTQREVTLTSAEPRALVKVTLDDAAIAVRELVPEQRAAAALIHAGKEPEALSNLQSIFKTWQNVKDIVEHCAALLEQPLTSVVLGLAGDGVGGGVGGGAGVAVCGTIDEASRRLVVQLQSVKASLARQDWSLLADTLEFDLCEQAQRWDTLLRLLAQHVGTLPPMASFPSSPVPPNAGGGPRA